MDIFTASIVVSLTFLYMIFKRFRLTNVEFFISFCILFVTLISFKSIDRFTILEAPNTNSFASSLEKLLEIPKHYQDTIGKSIETLIEDAKGSKDDDGKDDGVLGLEMLEGDEDVMTNSKLDKIKVATLLREYSQCNNLFMIIKKSFPNQYAKLFPNTVSST